MNTISKIIIPLFVIFIISYGLRKKINIYDSFLQGAKEGLVIVFNIFPALLAMVFAINVFLDSNIFTALNSFLAPFLNYLKVPVNIIPMALLRPISGSATISILNNIFANFGPDSYLGRLASVLQGCTDTTIYVLALYFSSVGIKKVRYSLGVGLFADLIGILGAFLVTSIFFS